jgi:hypothetical protein
MNSHQEHFEKEAFMDHFSAASQFKSKGSKRSRNAPKQVQSGQVQSGFVVVGGQSRFTTEGSAWNACSVEHHELVQSNTEAWQGYETRLVYAKAGVAQHSAAQAKKPSLAEAGEVLGSGLPDWPTWCDEFDTRLAYQQGVADCRVADNKVSPVEVVETLRGLVGALQKALPHLPEDGLAIHCGEWLSDGSDLVSKLEGNVEFSV